MSLIGLIAHNQRFHRRIFCVYHPVKNAPVLSIYISVFILFDQLRVAEQREPVSQKTINKWYINDLGAIIETRFFIGC